MRSERGFTLLEVMIALAILFGALVLLIGTTTTAAKASNRARMLTAAMGLAQGKMLDLEEQLLQKGFQDTAETLDGNFADEGLPKFRWEATVEKVQIPDVGQAQDKAAAPGSATTPGAGALPPLANFDPKAMGGAAILSSQFGIIKGVLENAIRKVTLTVRWEVGNLKESTTVSCYFTDPKAVDQAMAAGPTL